MLTQIFYEKFFNRTISKKKITAKLNIALYFFFCFDPISFQQVRKNPRIKRKTKKYLRIQIKAVKCFFSKSFLTLHSNTEQTREKDFLILKHYLENLDNLKNREWKELNIKNIYLTKSATKLNSSFFLNKITYLEDLLNI